MKKSNKSCPSLTPKKGLKATKPMSFDKPWSIAKQWYASDLGQALLKQEQYHLQQLLETIFGYNLIQLGNPHNNHKGLFTNSRTSYQYLFEPYKATKNESLNNKEHPHIVSCFDNLAIQNQSIDALILPHTLEFEAHPHQILREVERILIAEGKAIFLGFNPYSLYGLWHKYWEIKSHVFLNKEAKQSPPLPSCGHLISQKRLCDWLQLLGFDIESIGEYFYRPPVNQARLLKQLEFMEQAGQLSKILPAGAYILLATKRVSTLTPIRQRWKFNESRVGSESVKVAGFHSNKQTKGSHGQ